MIKIKILNEYSYYTNVEDYNAEVDETDLQLVPFQKKFDVTKKIIIDNPNYKSPSLEIKQINLRSLRERDCFPIINRGQLWYQTLTKDQLTELNKWYKDWLDVTKTLVVPTKPSWLE